MWKRCCDLFKSLLHIAVCSLLKNRHIWANTKDRNQGFCSHAADIHNSFLISADTQLAYVETVNCWIDLLTVAGSYNSTELVRVAGDVWQSDTRVQIMQEELTSEHADDYKAMVLGMSPLEQHVFDKCMNAHWRLLLWKQAQLQAYSTGKLPRWVLYMHAGRGARNERLYQHNLRGLYHELS